MRYHSLLPAILLLLAGCNGKQQHTEQLDTKTDTLYIDPETGHKQSPKSRTACYPDYSLIVYDAARPLSVQQKMWDLVKGTPQYIYVSNPSHGGGLHNYGLAVDVSILDASRCRWEHL